MTNDKNDELNRLQTAMFAVIKNARIRHLDYTPWHYVFIQDGKQCVCDGYRLIKVNEHIKLPEPPAPYHVDALNVFDEIRKSGDMIPLEMPKIKELRRDIQFHGYDNNLRKIDRFAAKHKFGEGKPTVTAVYLLDILRALPNVRADYNTESKVIYFASEAGEAILTPIDKEIKTVFDFTKYMVCSVKPKPERSV